MRTSASTIFEPADSFKYLLRDELKRHGFTFWSNEWCPRRSNGTSGMLFREPRAHVVSQYFECRDSEWALGNRDKWATSHGAFPRNSTKRDPYAGFKQWIRHFANNGDDDFGCYDPRDMQARYVTCSCERTCAHHLTQPHPTPARAAAGLAALDVVGVMEHFLDASACLVMDAVGFGFTRRTPVSRKRRTATARLRRSTSCDAFLPKKSGGASLYYGSTATASSTPSTILERSRTRSRRCLWGRSGWRTTSLTSIRCSSPLLLAAAAAGK